MRRIFLALTVAALMAVCAAPAQADVVDFDHNFDEDAVFVNDDSALFDDLCSPFINIDLAGCVFSDDDDNDFFVNDFDFDHDFDFDDDFDFDHDRENRRHR